MDDERVLESTEIGVLFERLERYDSLILAVSGGADSMALLRLAAEWARARGTGAPALRAVTVDHGLRAASSAEAAWVGEMASNLGVPHEILSWAGPKPSSGVEEKARNVRYALLQGAARRAGGRAAIVTAHHREDQVETFLMRLARGSGLDGLSGMRHAPATAPGDPAPVERPFLDVPKARLVASLEACGLTWIEDPMNDDARFERVRLREARPALAALGLDETGIACSMRRLARARDALDAATDRLMGCAVCLNGGAYARIDRSRFDESAEELRIRLVGRLLASYGGQDEPPRLSKVERLAGAMAARRRATHTLSGCIVAASTDAIEIFREPGREGLPEVELPPGETVLWDRRFLVRAEDAGVEAITIRGLGRKGFAALSAPDVRAPLPHRAAITLPSFWRGETLLAVPLLPPAHAGHTSAATPDRRYQATFILDGGWDVAPGHQCSNERMRRP